MSFLRVEAEAVPEVALRFNIAVVPTFLFLLGGELGDRDRQREREGRE